MAKNRRGRPVNGVLVLDKPDGMTSNAALQKVKRAYNARKAGHTGALDPLATGVLPLCFGEATKFSQFLLDADKAYDCTILLGQQTDTADTDGTVIASSATDTITRAQVNEAVAGFKGDIKQVPPMYSALKRDGKPLYELARKGLTVEREARPVTIHDIDVLDFRAGSAAEIDIRVSCSKGTYIRVLAEDVGRVLGVGACVKVLRRIGSGPFDLSKAVSLDQIEGLAEAEDYNQLASLLLPVDEPLQHLPVVNLDEDSSFYIQRGNPVQLAKAPTHGLVRLNIESGDFIGIGEILDDGRVAPRRLVQAE